jgi:hypothetical protein
MAQRCHIGHAFNVQLSFLVESGNPNLMIFMWFLHDMQKWVSLSCWMDTDEVGIQKVVGPVWLS